MQMVQGDETFEVAYDNLFTTHCILIQNDDKIVLSDSFISDNGDGNNIIVRLKPNGSMDDTFSGESNLFNSSVVSMDIQSDGKIIAAGLFDKVNSTTQNRIVRINSDGSLDESFNPGMGANNFILKVKIQEDDKILIGGSFSNFDGAPGTSFTRLTPNG